MGSSGASNGGDKSSAAATPAGVRCLFSRTPDLLFVLLPREVGLGRINIRQSSGFEGCSYTYFSLQTLSGNVGALQSADSSTTAGHVAMEGAVDEIVTSLAQIAVLDPNP